MGDRRDRGNPAIGARGGGFRAFAVAVAGVLALGVLSLLIAPVPARADGGAGGAGAGGAGGTGFTGNPGNAGAGGGGGGGAGGGNGGTGSVPGGGGGGPGTDGGAGGDSVAGAGGGGGGGGGNGNGAGAASLANSSNLGGGNGGAGGGGGNGGGGGGGAGGYGAIVTGSGSSSNSATIAGGIGGNGGIGAAGDGRGGNGGDGGVGVQFTASGASFTNSGTITGGTGGAGGLVPGITTGTNGANGAGGAGIVGGGLAITNSGTIIGGLGGDAATRANAVTFTGGTNTLTLQAGSNITGNVVAFSSADTLALGGSSNASFDLSKIGAAAQYQGFGVFQKTGSSTWTLTNTTTATTMNWIVSAGTLQLGPGASVTAGTLTVNGGLLSLGLSNLTVSILSGSGGSIDNEAVALIVNQSANSTYAGSLTGSSGALIKNGAGTLILTGNNSAYAGTMTVNGGTLQGDTTSLTVNIADNAALIFNQGSNGTFSSSVSGTGSLTKAGSGTLILDAINTYTGGTTVSGGTLEVGDASHTAASIAGDVSIGAAGTLTGHGTVGGSVTNGAGGIVAPGGSIGTLSIGGNYTQGATSSLQIEVSPSAASKLAVTGTASLAGSLVLVYDPGVYAAKTYTILSGSSVSGTFSTVSGTAPSGFAQSIGYSPALVTLSVDPTVVAPTGATIYAALGLAALDQAQQANTTLLSRLGGLGEGGDVETALAASRPVQVALGGDGGLQGLLAELPDAAARQQGGWVSATGNFASLGSSGGVPGFDSQSGGFLAGYDRAFGERLTAGVAGGYSHTNLSQGDGESGSLDTPRLALYGRYALGRSALDATLGYAHDFIDARRQVASGEMASSSHSGDEITAALAASRRYDVSGVTLLPSAGLGYVHLAEAGFAESGSPGFDLSVAHRDADSLRPFLAVGAAKHFVTASGVTVTPELDLAWSHELLDRSLQNNVAVGGGSFIIDGIEEPADQLSLGAGLSARLSDRLALAARYRAVLPTGNLFAQTVEAGLRYQF